MASERIIHIEWEGPLALADLGKLSAPRDRGLYQIYGHHPVYGACTLLYIGQTWKTFAQRISEEGWDGGSSEDPNNMQVYVGRLKGPATPSPDEWRREINLAEKLLIHVHGPAYNSENIMSVPESDPEVCNTRVFNWGCHRALRPEISGLRWTRAATLQANDYKAYE
jgi:hypothetical protein